ncbi:membrane protein insertion efficiency factor YidD [Candidatus Babeliales bacterium]|nr:membrane protein insertion efficiency factor YidD [Candidatus Babeliales bacterium]
MILINLKNWFWKFLHNIDRIVAQCLSWFILQARPFFGPPAICPFKIGCTQLAIINLEQFSVPVAVWHTSCRLIRCNPIWLWWHKN